MLQRRRELSTVLIYLLLTGGYAFFFTIVVTVNLIFQTQDGGLNALQLVLVGTALEATIFLCEVPTGVVADVYSRRRSIIIGLFLVGVGLTLCGVVPRFEWFLASSIVWGLGYTFISGAQQAWIADEIGIETAGRVYLRSAQLQQIVRLVAIPVSVGLATIDLQLPILFGGTMVVILGMLMWLIMPERGFTPRPREERRSWRGVTSTFREGSGLVRRTPLLVTVLCITAFYGMASEGFDRLWVKHFYDNLGFPSMGLEPVVWFGVVRFGAALLSIAAVEVVKRRIDTNSHAAVSRLLFAINVLQITSIVVFALGGGFTIGMLAFWIAVSLSFAYDPLQAAWINQNVDSRVRATVLSMNGQMDALGQIAGGPMLGGIGVLTTLRIALLSAGVCLSPALLLYTRAFKQGAKPLMPQPTASTDG